MNDRKPTILVIDDRVEDGVALRRRLRGDASVQVATPTEFKKGDLRTADLVLVDYELADWAGPRPSLTTPPSGLSLCAVVRDQIERTSRAGTTGVALYSGRVDAIAATLPDEVRGFVVARLNNLEWVFEKEDRQAPAAIVSLAGAIAALPTTWPEDSAKATTHLHSLLGLKANKSFFAVAAEDVSMCHPPVHELSTATHALALIRWLGQRILPYPAFLIDEMALAARLSLEPADIPRMVQGSALGSELARVRYDGALCDLLGTRWWRAGVDELVFEWTQGAGGASQLRAAIEERAPGASLLEGDHVPVIDDTYRPIGIAPIAQTVRLRPDDWPPFADEACALTETTRNSERLRGLVLPSDLSRLDG